MTTVARRSAGPTVLTFACGHCPTGSKPVTAPEGSLLELTRLCQEHHDARRATGLAEQKKALAEEARRAG